MAVCSKILQPGAWSVVWRQIINVTAFVLERYSFETVTTNILTVKIREVKPLSDIFIIGGIYI
jgi:hypothetical protein